MSRFAIAVSVYLLGDRKRRSLLGSRCKLAGGQTHDKAGAFLQLAFHLDGAAVRLNDPRHEAETEAQAFFRISRWNAIETVEDVRQMIGCDSNTGIFDDQQ